MIGFIGSFYDYEGPRRPDRGDARAARRAARRAAAAGRRRADARTRCGARPRPRRARQAIRFVGRVPHGEVERYYSLCDVMAYPRKASRLTELVTPLKPLEAMAQGKLVAASSVGGHRELIADGLTGTLFAPDDPADCAAVAGRPARAARRMAGDARGGPRACRRAARLGAQRSSLSGHLPSAGRPRRRRPAFGRRVTRQARQDTDLTGTPRGDDRFRQPYDDGAAKPPISLHPAFPAIVALWFAALLGARQPGAARGAARTRGRAPPASPRSFPPPRPPLGFTARGADRARRRARRCRARRRDRPPRRAGACPEPAIARRQARRRHRAARSASRTSSAAKASVNGESLPISRRRALAISEDDRPSDFLYRAPLPGEDDDAPAPFAAAPVVAAVADEEPLELSELAENRRRRRYADPPRARRRDPTRTTP